MPRCKLDYDTQTFRGKECTLFFFASDCFPQVAELCYTQLNLLLLAIESRKYEGGEIYINPKEKVINPNAIGERHIFDTTLQNVFRPVIFVS